MDEEDKQAQNKPVPEPPQFIKDVEALVNYKTNIADHILPGTNVLRFEATIDVEALKVFRAAHDEHLKRKSLDPIFSPNYTIAYTPNNVGISVDIICHCGEKADISDMSNF